MSKPTLLLVRHGNTFNKGDKVVWCGARTDLPLTEAGEEQAMALGARLQGVVPARVWTGPLQRTLRHAQLLGEAAEWQAHVEVSDVLREIDYGEWEALSTEEIEALGGKAELELWNSDAVWPKAPGWTPQPEVILRSAGEIMQEAARRNGVTVVVTSNGIMRFFGMRAAAATQPASLKVGTGKACVLVHNGVDWEVVAWNVGPDGVTLG
ncbi:MAG: histidine phosphatase family protein [Proteobacteria bacterium]|nr:histidine phosphatase family protein [Pseudomonadota bacterium]